MCKEVALKVVYREEKSVCSLTHMQSVDLLPAAKHHGRVLLQLQKKPKGIGISTCASVASFLGRITNVLSRCQIRFYEENFLKLTEWDSVKMVARPDMWDVSEEAVKDGGKKWRNRSVRLGMGVSWTSCQAFWQPDTITAFASKPALKNIHNRSVHYNKSRASSLIAIVFIQKQA